MIHMDNNAIVNFIKEIQGKLRAAIGGIDRSIEEGQQDIESMQEYYWLNYTEMDEYGYENYDNQRALFLQEGVNQEQRKLRSRYRKMIDSPFFGRVDFIYEGEDEPEVFYIGLANFSERKGMVPVIYDWRAPVSSLFYDYDAGPASYEAPGGILKGEITGKGQYKIRRGKLIYAFDSDVTIDDEVLARELSDKGSVSLKNIISTIQKEQNVIIRNTADRILVIQGVAGSGKTSVALHRIAYLLYHDRQNLTSQNVLILSPNGIFSDYISHILPELGEENIMEMSFDTFAYRELREVAFDTEDRCELMEKLLAGDDNPGGYKDKQSADFVAALDGFILMLDDTLPEFKDVRIRNWVMKAGEIEELFFFKFVDLPIMTRMEAIGEKILDEYETLYPPVSQEEKDEFYITLNSMLRTTDLYEIYNEFLEEQGMETLPDESYEKRIIPYADVYPILYLKHSLMARRDHRRIKHLIIDEMQDYTYLQYRILDRMFNCRMTILGDKAQTLDDKTRDVTSFLPGILGRDIRILQMNRSYRNTVEIAAWASEIAGGEAEQFERHGEAVEVYEPGSYQEAAADIAEKYYSDPEIETAAVITFTIEEARCMHDEITALCEKQGKNTGEISIIDNTSRHFRPGLTVIPYYLAKGLEFEQVYLIDNGKTGVIFDQARYIAATRALHLLKVYRTN